MTIYNIVIRVYIECMKLGVKFNINNLIGQTYRKMRTQSNGPNASNCHGSRAA